MNFKKFGFNSFSLMKIKKFKIIKRDLLSRFNKKLNLMIKQNNWYNKIYSQKQVFNLRIVLNNLYKNNLDLNKNE